jgi:hypothetical protein
MALQAVNSLSYVLLHGVPQEELGLGRLMFDLHTGRAWFGKRWAWIWIDILAFALALLAISGLILRGRASVRGYKKQVE